jgi:hypothetical protein
LAVAGIVIAGVVITIGIVVGGAGILSGACGGQIVPSCLTLRLIGLRRLVAGVWGLGWGLVVIAGYHSKHQGEGYGCQKDKRSCWGVLAHKDGFPHSGFPPSEYAGFMSK